MSTWRDRLNQLSGRTRFVVCRLFIHLGGEEVAPLLGVLNRTAREAMQADGDIKVLGKGLVEVCQNLLQLDNYWLSAANEGNVFWDEGEAESYVNELFTDSGQRYLSETDFQENIPKKDELLYAPVTRNLIVMITVAYIGAVPDLDTDLASVDALKQGLKALINLHYQDKLEAIQIHFSPAEFGDELTDEQILYNFPELLPL
jgi:uncharacterized membrane protein